MSQTSLIKIQKDAYKAVIAVPYTRIHGKPTRDDYHKLRDEAIVTAAAVENPFEEAHDTGVIGDIVEDIEFFAATGQNVPYVEPAEMEMYDPEITDVMDTPTRKRREADWSELLEFLAVRKGTLLGVGHNVRGALDTKYTINLNQRIHGYKNVTVKQYFQHLDSKWCKLTVKTIRDMKLHFYRGMDLNDPNEGVSQFIIRLEEEQGDLERDNITISEAEKLQHFLEQVNIDSRLFSKEQRKEWNNLDTEEQTWEAAVEYFEGLEDEQERDEEVDEATARGSNFESAAMAREREERYEAEIKEQAAAVADIGTMFKELMNSKEEAHSVAYAALQTSTDSKLNLLMQTVTNLQKQLQENSGGGGGNSGGPRGVGNENRNPNRFREQPKLRVEGEYPKCKHCNGAHPRFVGKPTEDECKGKDWPKHKATATQWLKDRMKSMGKE